MDWEQCSVGFVGSVYLRISVAKAAFFVLESAAICDVQFLTQNGKKKWNK